MGDLQRKVMVAIDESECSYFALMWALDNLKESIDQSPLVIFMAQPPPNQNLTFAASLGSGRMYCPLAATPVANTLKENQAKLTTALLGKAKDICASRGVSVETISEVGEAASAICTAVEQHNITLLVVGERGLGKLKRVLIGSVSNYCVQNAKCHVLVVKKP